MVHLTLAIADFMGILIGAALWAGASIAGAVLGGVLLLGCSIWLVRRMLRRRA